MGVAPESMLDCLQLSIESSCLAFLVGCATALPMGVAPESMLDCLQSSIDSSCLASHQSCILFILDVAGLPNLAGVWPATGGRGVRARSAARGPEEGHRYTLDLSMFFF